MKRIVGKEDGKISGLIDKGCSIEGRLAFDGTVQINGDFRGEIVSDGVLIIGSEAQVEGSIRVGSIIIEGSVKGEVESKEKIEMRRGSRLLANVKTPSLAIEEGSIFHGSCYMIDESIPNTVSDESVITRSSQEEVGDSLMM